MTAKNVSHTTTSDVSVIFIDGQTWPRGEYACMHVTYVMYVSVVWKKKLTRQERQ